MRVLVYAEIHQNALSSTTRELVTVAKRLSGADGRVEALVAHAAPESAAMGVGGVDETLVMRHEALTQYNPEAQLACLLAAVAVRKPDLVLLGYTSAGLDLGPTLAARLGWGLASYCTDAETAANGVVATCQIYGGKLSAAIDLSLPAVLMMTPGSAPEDAGAAPATLTELAAPALGWAEGESSGSRGPRS